jgi:hypothetical protein
MGQVHVPWLAMVLTHSPIVPGIMPPFPGAIEAMCWPNAEPSPGVGIPMSAETAAEPRTSRASARTDARLDPTINFFIDLG